MAASGSWGSSDRRVSFERKPPPDKSVIVLDYTSRALISHREVRGAIVSHSARFFFQKTGGVLPLPNKVFPEKSGERESLFPKMK